MPPTWRHDHTEPFAFLSNHIPEKSSLEAIVQTREERLRYAGLVLRNIMRNNIVRSWRLHRVGRLIRLSVALAFIAVALIFYARFAILSIPIG